MLLARIVRIELVVAHRRHDIVTKELLHHVEVRLTLPVDEVTRVQHIVDILLRPCKRITKRLLLTSAERACTADAGILLAFRLVRIGGSEMCIGDVQNRERSRCASINVLVCKNEPLIASTFRENRWIILREGGKRRDGNQSACRREKIPA